MASSLWPDMEDIFSTGSYSTEDYTTSTPLEPGPPGKGVADYWQYKTYTVMFLWVSPFLIILGTVGNVITFITLRNPLYKNSSTGFLLSCLAVVDTGMLNTGLLRHWIRMITDNWIDVRALTLGSCKVHYFFTYYLKMVSPMTVTLMTMERVISVVWPLKVKEICSRRRIKIVWFSLAIFLVIANGHGFWTMDIFYEERPHEGNIYNVTYCHNTEVTEYFHRGAWYWIDGTLSNFIPIILIFGGNFIIIYKIVSARRNRESDMKVKAKETGSTTGTTIMLLVVSIIFLLTTTPACFYFLGVGNLGWWPLSTAEDIAKVYLAYATVNLLFYVNNAVNFLLYCLSGSRFRRALMSTICCADVSLRPTTAFGTTTASKMDMSVTEVSKM